MCPSLHRWWPSTAYWHLCPVPHCHKWQTPGQTTFPRSRACFLLQAGVSVIGRMWRPASTRLPLMWGMWLTNRVGLPFVTKPVKYYRLIFSLHREVNENLQIWSGASVHSGTHAVNQAPTVALLPPLRYDILIKHYQFFLRSYWQVLSIHPLYICYTISYP